jgi:integrase
MAVETPNWIKAIRGVCPTGWSVGPFRTGVRLQVRKVDQPEATLLLKQPWAADAKEDLQGLIVDLKRLVDDGFDLKDAHKRLSSHRNGHLVTTSANSWQKLIDDFKADFDLERSSRPIDPQTWADCYAKFFECVVEVMGERSAPADASQLMAKVIQPWATNQRTRELCVSAVHRLLEFGVDEGRLPEESWTLSDRKRKKLRGKKSKRKTVATPTDAEILALLDSLPDTAAGERWGNCIKLLSVFGLRPIEAQMLEPRPHPDTNTPQMFCNYEKVCGDYQNDSRWLYPVHLSGDDGDLIDWRLAERMAADDLPLPSFNHKSDLLTYLGRQPYWKQLKAKYAAENKVLRPYSFRNSYSIRIHRLNLPSNAICVAMNHSITTHESSYEWATENTVLELLR